MVIEYLENLYQEMYEQKVSLEHDYKKNQLLLKENIQFIDTLENSLNRGYEFFSPHDINHENYEKIDSLKESQVHIKAEGDILEEKISALEEHLKKLENVLKVVRDNKREEEKKDNVLEENEIFRKKILETQEMERQRIARELHDSIVQSLTSIIYKIEFCSKLIDMDVTRCKLELQTVSKTVKKIIDDMRQVIYNLRPMSLDDIGLDVTLQREIAKLRSEKQIKVDYKIKGTEKKLSPLTSLTILRIIQEACNNVIKHANASHIVIEIFYDNDKVKILVQDDGDGFDVNSIKYLDGTEGSGFGISMMKERIYLLSGKISILSTMKKGTKIIAEIPIEEEV